jgi:Predicted methyltransferase regulatory domain/Methyltransferase domain
MSDDWTFGYRADIGYTHGYYRELSPVMLEFALLSKMQSHRVGRPLRYLELGYGQGLSLNVHAATVPGEYWGTDFNPAQAANAKDLAAASGAHIRVLDSSFEELATRDDLPVFDIIVLHGIWSWISDANRRAIVKIVRQRLAIGGILYISYNSTPGWSAAMPLRHLMNLHADLASGEALGVLSKVDGALAFAQSVVDSKAGYFKANPAVTDRLKKIKEQNRHYVAHEYFNADWLPMPFSDVAEYLSEAKLSFAASANFIEHHDGMNLTADQQKLLNDIKHPILKESVRDYMVNQQFRKDIWVKGARPMPPHVQAARMKEHSFVLMTPAADVPLTVKGVLGETKLQEDLFLPVLELLASNAFAPKTGAELLAGSPKQNYAQMSQVLALLIGSGHVSPTQVSAQSKQAQATSDALNASLIANAEFSSDTTFLASPLIGGAVGVTRFQQLFLKSIKGGRKTPAEWASDAWKPLAAQGQRLVMEGKTVEGVEENISALRTMAEDFGTKRLATLRALKIV